MQPSAGSRAVDRSASTDAFEVELPRCTRDGGPRLVSVSLTSVKSRVTVVIKIAQLRIKTVPLFELGKNVRGLLVLILVLEEPPEALGGQWFCAHIGATGDGSHIACEKELTGARVRPVGVGR